MKTIKGLLLGAAAALSMGSVASAADLPAAEPVEYVRICDAYGNGFFFIPGTDTCLRISGYVRVQAYYHGDNTTVTNWTGFGSQLVAPVYTFQAGATPGVITTPLNLVDQLDMGVRALMRFDARSRTEWGVLRSFFEFAADSGTNAINGTAVQIRYGFVQFGPVTAGVTDSFFNFDNGTYYGDVVGDRTSRVMLFAYTAAFGNGISATISLEDPTVPTGAGQAGIGGTTSGIVANGTGLLNDASQLPDLVGNIRVSQAWGTAQLSGIVGQRRFLDPLLLAPTGNIVNATFDETVWAIKGGLKINLDMLSRGSHVMLVGTYGEGSTNFIFTGTTGTVWQSARDINGIADERSLNALESWSLFANAVWFFTPALRGSIYGGYAEVDYKGQNFQLAANTVLIDRSWQVGANLQWTPVRNLDLGLDVFYTNVRYSANYNAIPGAVNAGRIDEFEEDGWGAIFRIQRSF